jgi:hypothetical protein
VGAHSAAWRRAIIEVGLLHPVVVAPEHLLVAGERRLAACSMGSISVTVVDLPEIVRGEPGEEWPSEQDGGGQGALESVVATPIGRPPSALSPMPVLDEADDQEPLGASRGTTARVASNVGVSEPDARQDGGHRADGAE